MLFNYPGESHGRGLLYGLELLEQEDSRFAVSIRWSGGPEEPTGEHLRVFAAYLDDASWPAWAGEEDTWTHPAAVDRMNHHFIYCSETLHNPIDAFAWAWCWDMEGESGGCDDAGWAGRLYTDFAKTAYTDHWDVESTAPCLRDYLRVWATYSALHQESAVICSTGPVDGATGCGGYQRWLKNTAIRDWVVSRPNHFLFDYADILSHNDTGELCTVTWDDHVYAYIHPDNAGNYDGGNGACHIGENGCLRLGKAAWVMLARIAGWDGVLPGELGFERKVDVMDPAE